MGLAAAVLGLIYVPDLQPYRTLLEWIFWVSLAGSILIFVVWILGGSRNRSGGGVTASGPLATATSIHGDISIQHAGSGNVFNISNRSNLVALPLAFALAVIVLVTLFFSKVRSAEQQPLANPASATSPAPTQESQSPASSAPAPQPQQPAPSGGTTAPPTRGSVCQGATQSNCAENNYGTQNYSFTQGYVPPPPRVMTKEQHRSGVEVLQTASKGATVFLVRGSEPDDKEINSFFDQVVGLFADADRWNIGGKDLSGPETQYVDGYLAHARGVGCQITNPSDGAGEIAKKALAAAGFPCTERIYRGNATLEKSIDIYVSVGTRIMPPK